MDVPTRPRSSTYLILHRFHPLARAAVGAIAGAILGKVASAIVGYLLYFVMLLSVLDRPVGIDSRFAAMAALPWLGWTFGALPGALSGAATLARQRLIAVFTGCLASLGYAFVEANRGNPGLGSLIAVISSLGAISAASALYVAARLLSILPGKRQKAA